MNQALNKLPSLDSALKSLLPNKKYSSYIFLDRDFFAKINTHDVASKKSFGSDKKCIVISPSLYWIRKKELIGINGLHKTKKIAEVVFEDLEENNEYKKIALKGDGNVYYFVAIDTANIRKYLTQHIGIEADGLDFALSQDIFGEFSSKQIEINESYSLANIDGIVEKVPSAYLEGGQKLQLSVAIKTSKAKLSNFTFKTNKTENKPNHDSEIKNGKWLKIALAAVATLSISMMVEGVLNIKRAISVDKKTEATKEQYKLPQTTLEMDNIISKAKNIERTQNHMRGIAKVANSINLQQGESIESIKLSPSESSITVKTQRVTEIENTLKKEINITKTEKGVDSVTFKASLK